MQDLMEIYGTDLYDPGCRVTWLSLRTQILGLMFHPRSRVWRVLAAE